MFNYNTVLITGGTGSFGKEFIKEIIIRKKNLKKLIIFSRDEWKQSELQKKYPQNKFPFIRFFLGDVRDYERVRRAFKNIDLVIHAAALKQVPAAEYNPIEFVKTNIMGAQNIIEASIEENVKKVIALSTDKATAPLNLYGATKLCSDKLFIAANNYSGKNIFSICRYGNVMGSRGSVIPLFIEQSKKGFINLTDKSMTRFNITLKESIELVFFAINNSIGREIFIPKLPSYKIVDLARAINEKVKFKIIGIRPGEKVHEEMITIDDSINTIESSKYYITLPALGQKMLSKYLNKYKAKKIKNKFSYNSRDNKYFLEIKEIRTLIKNLV